MAFTLKQVADISVEVEIQVPGEKEVSTLTARWRLHPFSEQQAIYDKQQAGDVTDDDLVESDLLGLEGIKDEDGNDAAFDKQLVQQLMDIPYVRRPLVLSWFQAQQGKNKAAAKN